MKLLKLVQGSDEWLEARLNYLCASEAPAMMGASKFMSRNELLDLKNGWKKNPNSKFKERLFSKGHENEDSARDVLETEMLEMFPPAVGLEIVEIGELSLELLASFDGLMNGLPGADIWEHKDWNMTLAENVRNSILEPHYYWQLEHQCLVNGVDSVAFTCSDGGDINRVSMRYVSMPQRRGELINGWCLFVKDLENHEAKAKVEKAVAADYTGLLPAVSCKVQGTELVTNIGDCLTAIKDLAEDEMSKTLENDQDFANKESLNKDVKKARAALKATLANVQGEFVSYSQFAETAAELDSVLQQMQSHGEKQVKQEKEARKQAILNGASNSMVEFLSSAAPSLNSNVVHDIAMTCQPNFVGVMKGKRTIESLQSAVDDELARCKREIAPKIEVAASNLAFYVDNAAGFEFLFPDINQNLNHPTEAFEGIIARRIQSHKEVEEKRLEQERELIRLEEEAKANRRIQAEAMAKEEADRQRIRDEEREKAQAEVKPASVDLAGGGVVSMKEEYQHPNDCQGIPARDTSEALKDAGEEFAESAKDVYPLQTAWEELAAWCSKYEVSLQASQELEEIIKKHI